VAAFKKGIFRGYWRSILRDPQAATNGLAAEERIAFRRPRFGTRLTGEARQVQDTAYSPDGTVLATAHWYNADPGEVELWDTKTGKLIVSLPVTIKDAGVLALAFSPDGFWAQSVAFAPDGRTLAGAGKVIAPGNQGGEGQVRLFDLAQTSPARRAELSSHHEGRNRPNYWMSDVVFTPDGRQVAPVAMQTRNCEIATVLHISVRALVCEKWRSIADSRGRRSPD
jgi:hypothetical protein